MFHKCVSQGFHVLHVLKLAGWQPDEHAALKNMCHEWHF